MGEEIYNEELQGIFLECWGFFYILILVVSTKLYTIIKIIKVYSTWPYFIACELYIKVRKRQNGKNKHQSCVLIYATQCYGHFSFNTFSFLESKFQASSKGCPLESVDSLPMAWSRQIRLECFSSAETASANSSLFKIFYYFYFFHVRRLILSLLCMWPEQCYLDRKTLSAVMWVGSIMAHPWKSPSVWVLLPVLAGADWMRHLPCLWFRAGATALSHY